MPVIGSFDRDNLVIVLASGLLEVDAEDIYSEWKLWAADVLNAGIPEAFRSTGGDPLTPGVNAGAYFFLQNQHGWRIRPAEEDGTITLTGNLAPEDSTFPILAPTIGDFSVLISGLQPVTQNVDDVLTLQEQVSTDVKLIKALNGGNVTVTGTNPFVLTVYDADDDNIVLATYNVSSDGRNRTRLT